MQVLLPHNPNMSFILSVTKRCMNLDLRRVVIITCLMWVQNLRKMRAYHLLTCATTAVEIFHMLRRLHRHCHQNTQYIAIDVTIISAPHHATVPIYLSLNCNPHPRANPPVFILSTQLPPPPSPWLCHHNYFHSAPWQSLHYTVLPPLYLSQFHHSCLHPYFLHCSITRYPLSFNSTESYVPVLPPLYPSYLQNFYHYLLPASSNIYSTVQGSDMPDRKSYGSDGENDDILTTLIVHLC